MKRRWEPFSSGKWVIQWRAVFRKKPASAPFFLSFPYCFAWQASPQTDLQIPHVSPLAQGPFIAPVYSCSGAKMLKFGSNDTLS